MRAALEFSVLFGCNVAIGLGGNGSNQGHLQEQCWPQVSYKRLKIKEA